MRATIKRLPGKIAYGMKRLLAKSAIGGKKVHPALDRDVNATVRDMLTNPDDRTVRPINVISSLLNGDDSMQHNVKEIKDFLINNANSSLFSSANLDFNGNTIIFKQPGHIPGSAIPLAKLTIDGRDSHNGEFRGALALKVLRHPGLTFGSLAELCAIMTINDELNVVKMRTAHIVAAQLNKPSVSKALITNDNQAAIDSLVKFDSATQTYMPLFPYPAPAPKSRPAADGQDNRVATPPTPARNTPDRPEIKPRPPWLNAKPAIAPGKVMTDDAPAANTAAVTTGVVEPRTQDAGATVLGAGNRVKTLRQIFEKQ